MVKKYPGIKRNKIVLLISAILILIAYMFVYVYIFQALIFKWVHQLNISDIYNYLYVYKEIFINKDYDLYLPSTGSTVFDVGGNQGLYTLYLNSKFSNINIHLFEPIPALFHETYSNVMKNKKHSNNIYCNNFGLSDRKSTAIINYFPLGSALSTMENDLDHKRESIIQSKCSNAIISTLCRVQ